MRTVGAVHDAELNSGATRRDFLPKEETRGEPGAVMFHDVRWGAEHDGRWWMYYSCGEGDTGHSLRVAVADSPVGPYVDQGVDLTPDERRARSGLLSRQVTLR